MHIKTERTCIVCKQKQFQKNLFRLNAYNNNIEVSDRKFGRGAYICKQESCINNLLKNKSLNKTFKLNVNANIYLKIQEQLIEKLKD